MPILVRHSIEVVSGTFPATLPVPENEPGDFLLAVGQSYGAFGVSDPDWTPIGSGLVAYYRFVGATPVDEIIDVNPYISGRPSLFIGVFKGVHTTDPFDGQIIDTINAVGTGQSKITNTANALALAFRLRSRWTMPRWPFETAGMYSTGFTGITLGTVYQEAPGATPAPQYHDSDTAAHTYSTIILRDDGSNLRAGYHDPAASALNEIVGFDPNGYEYADWPDAETAIPSVTNTIPDPDFTMNTLGVTTSVLPEIPVSYHRRSGFRTGTGSSSLTGILSIGLQLTASKNLSGEILSVMTRVDRFHYTYKRGLGELVALSDGVNSRIWHESAKSALPDATRGSYPFVFEVDGGFHIQENGVFNAASVDKLFYGRANNGTWTFSSQSPLFLLRTVPLVGGSPNRPASYADIHRMITNSDAATSSAQNEQATGQYLFFHPVTLGGSRALHFDGRGQSAIWPDAIDMSVPRAQCQVSAGKFPHIIDLSDGDYLDLRGVPFNMGNGSQWGFAATCSTHASTTCLLDGVVVRGAVPLLNTITVNGVLTFDTCGEVVYTSLADMSVSGGFFKNCTAAQQITITSPADFAKIQNWKFQDCAALAIKITGDHGGQVWSASGMKVSGGGGAYDIEYTGTGALTITADSGSGWSTSRCTATGGGSITVSAPANTLSINTDVTATIRYFDGSPDDQTPNDSTTGVTLDYAYATTDPVDIEAVAQGYVPVNRQDITPINGDYDIEMDLDEAYSASHALAITTHYTYDRATKVLAILADQDAFDVRSSLADTIRTNSAYYNTKLLLEAKPGGKRIDLINGATISDMATWKGAGMERYDALGTIYPIEKWYAIQSVSDITGASVIYRQTNSGDFTIGALTGGKFDETLKFYSDTTVPPDNSPETNNNSYLLIKALRVGYRQARNDVVAGNGGNNLKADLYTIGLSPEAHSYAGNPATDLSLTMTLVAGGTVGGKTFAYKWVDAATNSGTDIADWINYKGATDPNGLIPGGTGLRWAEMPDMIIYVSGGVETAQGYREGATPMLVGFYMERSGADHPDMVRAQADDGTYYTPAVTANITITNLPDDVGGNTRLQIYNVTTASEYYNDDPAGTGYSDSYTDGVGISAGDSLRIRFAHLNAGTSFEYGETFTTASSSGFTVDGNNFIAADSVYASNGINGSTITNFTADFVEDQIEIASDTDFTAAQAYAFYCYNLTGATGIGDFWGGVTAIDTGNYRINTSVVSIYFDSPVGVTYSVKQTDTGRIFRSDDAYPVKDPTTSGYGVQLNWKNVVYVQNVGGSALTAAESAALTSIKSKTDSLTFTVAGQVDANCESMNAHALQGDGSESDKIRTVNAP